MAQGNVELMRALWDPMAGTNIAAIDWDTDVVRELVGQAYSDEIEVTTLQSGFGAGVGEFYAGTDGVVSYLREWFEPFSEYYIDNLDYIGIGDCVVIPTRQRGVGAASGAVVEIDLVQLFEIADGKVVRWHQYDTIEEARADAEGRAGT